jgi:shikimate dehydrogenase
LGTYLIYQMHLSFVKVFFIPKWSFTSLDDTLISMKKCAVIGDPIEHSASPAMHNAAYKELGLEAQYNYTKIHVTPDKLGEFFEDVRNNQEEWAGINVTVPHKEAVLDYLNVDELDASAKFIGAVNTIIVENEKLIGCNTDALGFIEYALINDFGFNPLGKSVAIIGAGGAAKAMAFGLAAKNEDEKLVSRLLITDIDLKKAASIKENIDQFNNKHGIDLFTGEDRVLIIPHDEINELLSQVDLVINATPVGMPPLENKSPITDFSWVTPQHYCFDAIYKPAETLFLKECKKRGAKTLNGASMLAGQGAKAFELFTGETAPYKTMLNAII